MVKVNEKDARLICECLNIAKQYLEESTPANEPTKAAINKKINDIYELIKKIEKYAGYDFFKQINIMSIAKSTFTFISFFIISPLFFFLLSALFISNL